DRLVLSFLYRPIIGSKARDIYETLYELLKDKTYFEGPVVLLVDLMSDNNIVNDDLNDGISLLAKYKLLKVLTSTTFELYQPYSSDEFYASPLFKELKNNVSNAQLEYIKNEFKFDGIESNDSDLSNLKYKTVRRKKEAFTFERFKESAKEAGYTISPLDQEFFLSLSSLYNLVLDDVLVILYEASDDYNNYDKDEIIKVAYKKYSINFKNKDREQAFKEEGDELYINYFKNTKPETVLKKSSINERVLDSERSIIERLREEYSMKDEVISVLIVYCLATKDGRIPSYAYFSKIAKDWAKNKIENANDAYYYITSLLNNGTMVKNKKYKSAEDWYEEYLSSYKKEMNQE
ncbi:MAG: DnaD domain protein, partial [Gammaproteobacteria bacterium]|nr:DnaD domain protein [Gammaproteobacteria bacterium]